MIMGNGFSRSSGMAVVALGAALALPSLPGPAGAAAPTALLRVAHLSPDAPPLEVRVDGHRLNSVSFTGVSAYATVPAGSHSISLRGGAVNLSTTTSLSAGSAHTVAAMGRATTPQAKVFTDRLSAPPSGDANVRVVHAAPGVPAADVVAQTGAVLFRDISFAEDPGYRSVPGGSYSVTMRRAGTNDILLAVRGIAVQPGTVYSIWAVGGGGRALQLVRSRDAAGMGTAPAGGVTTGYGGTAPGRPAPVGPGLLGGLVLIAAGGMWLGLRRRS